MIYIIKEDSKIGEKEKNGSKTNNSIESLERVPINKRTNESTQCGLTGRGG